MALVKKLYFSFLIFCSLLVIGLSLYYGLKKPNNNATPDVPNQEIENQQKIDETENINNQDKLLSDQIRLTTDRLQDYNVEKEKIKNWLIQNKNITENEINNMMNPFHIIQILENPKSEYNISEETKKLKNYQLFLDQQLLSFERINNKITREIQAFKENKPIEEKKKKKTFQDVYGMEEEKEQFANLIHSFNTSKHVIGYENVRPKGILLYGPPGTGKSHLMEALSGEINAHYIPIVPSQFDKKYVGDGNDELEKIWAEAESYDKTMIFIDEISGLVNREDNNNNKCAENIVNNLLVKLDGFKKTDKKIILMGATNHLEKIDKALRNRFQKEIKIDSFKKEEIPGFFKWFMLKNNYRLSYHAFNHLENLVKRVPEETTLSNRDWVSVATEAFMIYDRLAFKNSNHEVMLPSDLDESLDNHLKIKKTKEEILAYRKKCEDQYAKWKACY
jgi:cell division protease FtsH